MGSGKRRFRPDYGLRLSYDGFSPTVDLYFYNFRLYRLNVLGRGQYSTMVEMPYANKPYALSLDFNETQLDQILAKAASEVRFFIKSQLATDPATPRCYRFQWRGFFRCAGAARATPECSKRKLRPLDRTGNTVG
jgi:hypothetical protein